MLFDHIIPQFWHIRFDSLCSTPKRVLGCQEVYVRVACIVGTGSTVNEWTMQSEPHQTSVTVRTQSDLKSKHTILQGQHLRASDPPRAEIRPPTASRCSIVPYFCPKPEHLPASSLFVQKISTGHHVRPGVANS